jgi:hypothetical protein
MVSALVAIKKGFHLTTIAYQGGKQETHGVTDFQKKPSG